MNAARDHDERKLTAVKKMSKRGCCDDVGICYEVTVKKMAPEMGVKFGFGHVGCVVKPLYMW